MAGIGSSLSSPGAANINTRIFELTDASTEYAVQLTNNCKSFEIKSRDGNYLRGSTNLNGTDDGGDYNSIFKGCSWEKVGFNLPSKTLYIRSEKAGDILEITETF